MAKKKSRRDEYEDDDLDEIDEQPKPKSDAYTGIVVITTIALIAAALLFYFDADGFANAKNANPTISPNALAAASAPTKN